MKKLFPLLFICLFLTGCTENKKYCLSTEGLCLNQPSYNCLYCTEHTCTKDGCKQFKYSSDEYCAEHKGITTKDSNKLTDSQLTKCRAVVDEYCENLKKTQSNIQAIYVPDDEPEVYAFYIMYKCYVTRGDNVDTATIHVIMSDGDVFKVDKLEYDK